MKSKLEEAAEAYDKQATKERWMIAFRKMSFDPDIIDRPCKIAYQAGAKWLLAEAEKISWRTMVGTDVIKLSDLKKLMGINPGDLNLGEEE